MLLIYENDFGKKRDQEDDEDDGEKDKDIRLTNDIIQDAFEPLEQTM